MREVLAALITNMLQSKSCKATKPSAINGSVLHARQGACTKGACTKSPGSCVTSANVCSSTTTSPIVILFQNRCQHAFCLKLIYHNLMSATCLCSENHCKNHFHIGWQTPFRSGHKSRIWTHNTCCGGRKVSVFNERRIRLKKRGQTEWRESMHLCSV